MSAGGPFEMTIAGQTTVSVRDVLVGDVWFCSGQSNMEVRVSDALDPEKEIAAAQYPNIRFIKVRGRASLRPLDDIEAMPGHGIGVWMECSPDNLRLSPFSAVAYFFGRELNQRLDVPIGLVDSCWGGTSAQCWVNLDFLKSDVGHKPSADWVENLIREHPDILEDFQPYYLNWSETWGVWWRARQEWEKEGKAQGEPAPSDAHLGGLPGNPLTATGAYNAMLKPVIPYAIKGVIWYQGEANTGDPDLYRKMFPALIKFWRNEWGEGDFPFIYVQLANFDMDALTPTYSPDEQKQKAPVDDNWARLREVQLQTLNLVPNTGMAVAIDVGETANVHPRNKQAVGRRLALVASAKVYGQDVVCSGPICESMDVEGDRVRLHFRHTDGGLVAKDGKLVGFAIAGDDRHFVWGEAAIDGDSVVVRSDEVPAPVSVRYAWDDDPLTSLYNGEGLPASPFRTDNWPKGE
jgi:sialate O-acetylesterase